MPFKPTLALDFDGVVHSYERGWQQGQIYGTLTPGFLEWAAVAQQHFKLVIHSSRAPDWVGADQIGQWLNRQLEHWRGPEIEIEVAIHKPPAFMTIDDRSIRFEGNWRAPELQPEAILAFKPWMQR